MIKRITGVDETVPTTEWLDLTRLADVEVTSEQPVSPIEGVFSCDAPAPWRAAVPGVQTIRLRFRRPARLTRIRLIFEETAIMRTQEFVLRWQAAGAPQAVDILRQQFTFAPPDTTTEREEYRVDLVEASTLELSITPHIGGGYSIATLKQFCVAAVSSLGQSV
jgi:hypothetical protein